MVLAIDVLNRVEEAGKYLCPKSGKALRGEALSRFDCRRFGEMMDDTSRKLAADLSEFYFKEMKKTPAKREKASLEKIYYSLFMEPAKSLKKNARFVSVLNKVKAEDLKKTVSLEGVGIFAAMRLLKDIWLLDSPDRYPLAKVLFLVIAKGYANSLEGFHKLCEYTGVEGPMGNVGDASRLIERTVTEFEECKKFELR